MTDGNRTIIETPRLLLREMTAADRPDLCMILQDKEVMYAYNGPFSDEEVDEWLERQLARYRQYGYGLWAVVLKATGEMIGQCGLTLQQWNGREMLEVGYLFQRSHWHQGYATEAARACMEYAFNILGASEVCSIIRDNNIPSQRVALRNGMRQRHAESRRGDGKALQRCGNAPLAVLDDKGRIQRHRRTRLRKGQQNPDGTLSGTLRRNAPRLARGQALPLQLDPGAASGKGGEPA